MFLTVFGQKGGVAKTCTSIHLACVWAQQGLSVCVVDADRNRSATAYAARGYLIDAGTDNQAAGSFVPLYSNISINREFPSAPF